MQFNRWLVQRYRRHRPAGGGHQDCFRLRQGQSGLGFDSTEHDVVADLAQPLESLLQRLVVLDHYADGHAKNHPLE